jgi:peptidoglycan/xylan/chitin deacetylase (PgdA/CDA1 family)
MTMDTLSALESTLVRVAGTLLSRRGRAASLVVLIYHRVTNVADPMMPSEPDARRFAAQMSLLADNFIVLPLREGVQRLRAGTLPARAVCITFDDGYANNFTVAMPILQSRGLTATVFVAPAFLNGGCMFNDTVYEAIRQAPAQVDLRSHGLDQYALSDAAARINAAQSIILKLKHLPPAERRSRAHALAEHVGARVPADLMMTDEQVARMSASGIEIGAHTMTHPILAAIDAAAARTEINASKERLQEITGTPVRSFAYPNGKPGQDYHHEHVALAREAGFELAVSTTWGAATAAADPLQIPRIAPWDQSALRYAARLVSAYRDRQFRVA